MSPFLNLVKDPGDAVYDPSHCVALVLVHIRLASLYFWLQTHDPEKTVAFEAICKEATRGSWKPPQNRKIEQGEWRATCKQTKSMSRNDAFSQAIEDLLPASKNGSIAVDPRSRGSHVLWNPTQQFLHLLRHLCKQVLPWDPENVHNGDRACNELHWLFNILGLPRER